MNKFTFRLLFTDTSLETVQAPVRGPKERFVPTEEPGSESWQSGWGFPLRIGNFIVFYFQRECV